MYSTNPGSWVTFDDDPTFQSSQKRKDFSLETQGVCRPNGLKLNLPGLGDPPSASSSTSSTPLSSPMVDFYFSPGPPSNSPLSTPTKDFPGFPGIPKAGTHVLYPIPECSSSCPPTTAGEAGSPLSFTKPTCSPHASLPSVHSPTQLTPTLGLTDDTSPQWVQSEARQFKYFHDDCAFSNPFWKDEGSASLFPLDSLTSRKPFSPKDKEVPIDQKSLNQCSLNYICEKLEHLQSAETKDPLGNLSMQNPYAGDTISFVPHTLFRSQPKAGWPFMLRIPEKKNMMSSRQWGPIFLKVLPGGILQMYYERGLEKPFKEFQLDPHCRLSEPKLENFSMAGKIHTVKVEHVTYSEKRKYHSKTEVVHEPEVEQMLKLGSTEHRDFLEFLTTIEEELIKLPATAKPKNKNYEEQEICLDILDSFWGKITKEEGKLVESAVVTQICCLCFLNGPAECFLALNDLELQKRDECYFEKVPEKKGIDILNYHFHTSVKAEEFEQSRIIKFVPLDACRFELMRFKTSYEGDELPFAVKSIVTVQGAYVELQAFVNMTPAAQRSPHAGPLRSCNNIMIHFPVPAQWIKALWTRNLQRQKSLKAKMNRRACLGSLQEPESEPVIQVTVGSAKYESAYRAVVWKIDRLPDKNSSPDQPHSLSYKLELGSDQEVPSDWYPFATVQFSMSEACASRTEVRSLGVESDAQPQKHVCQRACYNIQVEIEKKWIQVEGEEPDKTGGCVTQ